VTARWGGMPSPFEILTGKDRDPSVTNIRATRVVQATSGSVYSHSSPSPIRFVADVRHAHIDKVRIQDTPWHGLRCIRRAEAWSYSGLLWFDREWGVLAGADIA
jgi:hypothetical protein